MAPTMQKAPTLAITPRFKRNSCLTDAQAANQSGSEYSSSEESHGDDDQNSQAADSDQEEGGAAGTTLPRTQSGASIAGQGETVGLGLKRKASKARMAGKSGRRLPTLEDAEPAGCAARTRTYCVRARTQLGGWLFDEERAAEKPTVWRVFTDIRDSDVKQSSFHHRRSLRPSTIPAVSGDATFSAAPQDPPSAVTADTIGSLVPMRRQEVLERRIEEFEDELAARPTCKKVLCPAVCLRFWTYEFRAPSWLVNGVNKMHVGRRNLAAMMDGYLVRSFILVCILLNTASLAADHYMISDSFANVLRSANQVFTIIFIVEAALKILGDGFLRYLSDGFNRFDFVIVCVSILELTVLSGTAGLGAFRVIRVFRVVRIVRYLRSMQVILSVVVRSLPSFSYIALLLFLFAFIYAVLGMQLFGGTFDPTKIGGEPGDPLPRNNFDTLHAAFVTVFQVLAGEAWNEVMSDWVAMTTPWHMLYFMSWVIIGQFILLNLFLAILLDNFGAAGDEEEDLESEVDDEELAELDAQGAAVGEIQRQAIIKAQMRKLLEEAKRQAKEKRSTQKRGGLTSANFLPDHVRANGSGPVSPRAESDRDDAATAAAMPRGGSSAGRSVPRPNRDAARGSHKRRSMILEEPEDTAPHSASSTRRGSSVAGSGTDDDNPSLPPWRVVVAPPQSPVEDIIADNVLRLWKSQPMGQSNSPGPHVPVPINERVPGVTELRSPPGPDTPTKLGWGALKSGRMADLLTSKVEAESAARVRRASLPPASAAAEASHTGVSTSKPAAAAVTTATTSTTARARPNESLEDDPIIAKASALAAASEAASAITMGTDISAPEGDTYAWPFKTAPGWRGRHLFLFPPNGVVSRFWRKIVSPDYPLVHIPWCGSKPRSITFDNIVLICIIISSIILASEGPPDDDGDGHSTTSALGIIEIIFTVIFAFEIVVKAIAHGLVLHRHAYLRSGYNVVDFIVVCASVFSLVLSGSSEEVVRILRLLRCLRPLRMVSRNKGLKMVITALIRSIGGLVNVAGVLMLVWLMFAILGVQLFAGQMHQCNDPDFPPDTPRSGRLAANSTPNNVVYSVLPCDATVTFVDESGAVVPREWTVERPNFDNVFEAMLTLFVVSSGEGWPDVMFRASDTTGVDRSPEEEAAFWNAYYFVIFVCVGAFFFLDLFVGVVFDNFMRLKRKLDWFGLLTDDQRIWVEEQRRIASIRPPKIVIAPKQAWRRKLFTFVSSTAFEVGVMTCILLNVVSLAITFYEQPSGYTLALDIANWVFTIVFTVEAVLRIVAYGAGAYFKDPWYRFDFFVVLASVADVIVSFFDASLFRFGRVLSRVFRILRVGRVVRLAKKIDGLRTLMMTLWYSLPSLVNVGALLLLLLVIYAIIGVQVFGNIEAGENLNRHANFQSFPLATLTLFRISTGEGWEGIMFDTMDEAKGGTPWAPLYFVSYVTIAMFIMVNLFVMILLEDFEAVEEQSEHSVGVLVGEFNTVWSQFDPAGKRKIPANQVESLLRSLPPPYGISPSAPFRVFLERLRVLQLKAWGPYVHYGEVLAALHRVATGAAIPGTVLAATGTAPVAIQRKIQHKTQKRVARKQRRQTRRERLLKLLPKWAARWLPQGRASQGSQGSEQNRALSPTSLTEIAKRVRATKAAAKAAAAADVEGEPPAMTSKQRDRIAPVRHTQDDLSSAMTVLHALRDMRVDGDSSCESGEGDTDYEMTRLRRAMVDESTPVDYAELVASMTLRANVTAWIKRTRARLQNKHQETASATRGAYDHWRSYKRNKRLLGASRSTRRILFPTVSASTSFTTENGDMEHSEGVSTPAQRSASVEATRKASPDSIAGRPPRNLASLPQGASQSARNFDIPRIATGAPAITTRRGASSVSPIPSPLRVEAGRRVGFGAHPHVQSPPMMDAILRGGRRSASSSEPIFPRQRDTHSAERAEDLTAIPLVSAPDQSNDTRRAEAGTAPAEAPAVPPLLHAPVAISTAASVRNDLPNNADETRASSSASDEQAHVNPNLVITPIIQVSSTGGDEAARGLQDHADRPAPISVRTTAMPAPPPVLSSGVSESLQSLVSDSSGPIPSVTPDVPGTGVRSHSPAIVQPAPSPSPSRSSSPSDSRNPGTTPPPSPVSPATTAASRDSPAPLGSSEAARPPALQPSHQTPPSRRASSPARADAAPTSSPAVRRGESPRQHRRSPRPNTESDSKSDPPLDTSRAAVQPPVTRKVASLASNPLAQPSSESEAGGGVLGSPDRYRDAAFLSRMTRPRPKPITAPPPPAPPVSSAPSSGAPSAASLAALMNVSPRAAEAEGSARQTAVKDDNPTSPRPSPRSPRLQVPTASSAARWAARNPTAARAVMASRTQHLSPKQR